MKRMRRLLLPLAIAALLGLSACSSEQAIVSATPVPSGSSTSSSPAQDAVAETIHIEGGLGVTKVHAVVDKKMCAAYDQPYARLYNTPTQAVIKDATGATVAVAEISEDSEVVGDNLGCVRSWSADIPAGGKFYSAEVGELESRTYSEEELATTRMSVLVDP